MATANSPRSRDNQLQALGLLSIATLLVGLYMAFIYAPTDALQGHAQRIFYIHVPMAWLAYLSFTVIFIGSVGYVWKRRPGFDRLARSSAELGFIFTTLVLVTGSLWGRPIWGAWWSWDARLTTTLILWFVYLGYFMVRAYAGDAERAARYAAVLGILGAVDLPIIHLSVTWWRTLHPAPVVLKTSGPDLPNSMLATLIVCFVGFTLLYAYLMALKLRIETARDALAERELTALLAAPADAAPAARQLSLTARDVAGGSED
jgi:heme exporter protein C